MVLHAESASAAGGEQCSAAPESHASSSPASERGRPYPRIPTVARVRPAAAALLECRDEPRVLLHRDSLKELVYKDFLPPIGVWSRAAPRDDALPVLTARGRGSYPAAVTTRSRARQTPFYEASCAAVRSSGGMHSPVSRLHDGPAFEVESIEESHALRFYDTDILAEGSPRARSSIPATERSSGVISGALTRRSGRRSSGLVDAAPRDRNGEWTD